MSARDCGGMQGVSEQIIESLSSGVVAVDRDGTVLTANRAARAFLGADESVLAPGRPLGAHESAAPLLALLREVVETGASVSRREVAVRVGDEAARELGLSVSVLRSGGAVTGAILLFTDLTELRQLERAAELNRQLAALGELTAGVVHEIRNPVSVISGMAELLIRRLAADDDQRGAAETILRETSGLERLISQFLGFARPYDVERSWCVPEDIARRAMQFCQRRAQRKSIALDMGCEPDLPKLHVDAARIAQALANLLANAVDAAPDHGRVGLQATRDGAKWIVFEITDNGPGVGPGDAEQLFKPFYTNKEGGTGLGLTITHRIVHAHGGAVRVSNRLEGGARFEVLIPLPDEGDGEAPVA